MEERIDLSSFGNKLSNWFSIPEKVGTNFDAIVARDKIKKIIEHRERVPVHIARTLV